MWKGVFPAVTTKFHADDSLDRKEMERCFALQVEAGVDGLIVAGSLGEGPMLSLDEKTEIFKIAKSVSRFGFSLLCKSKPVQAPATARRTGRTPLAADTSMNSLRKLARGTPLLDSRTWSPFDRRRLATNATS